MPIPEPSLLPPGDHTPITAWDLPDTDGRHEDPGQGSPHDRLVVVGIADFTASGLWFGDVAITCGHRVRLIAPDLRGRGASWAAPAPESIDDHVADILAIVDRLGLDEFSLVAHGTGAAIALSTFAKAPRRVTRLILIDGPPKCSPSQTRHWTQAAALVDPGAVRIRANYAHRNEAITEGLATGRLPQAGMSPALRRVVEAETVGSGFGWRARLGASTLGRDWSLLTEWRPPDESKLTGTLLRAAHGQRDDEAPIEIWDLPLPEKSLPTTHAGAMWDPVSVSVITESIVSS